MEKGFVDPFFYYRVKLTIFHYYILNISDLHLF